MPKFSCQTYGFDCNYFVEGNDIDDLMEEFDAHSNTEHGISYGKEVLTQFLLRMRS